MTRDIKPFDIMGDDDPNDDFDFGEAMRELDERSHPGGQLPPAKVNRGDEAKTIIIERGYPCAKCRGTGVWTSPSGRMTGKCHACQGKGHFATSITERFKRRTQAAASKATKLREARAAWDETYPGLGAWLEGCGEWSDFQIGRAHV